ncbi:hypothetical protein CLV92_110116 [Kineococcus xinjiangensis]|uniref:Uncharacterized protein n=1 Tax=Kineococcus xinjiangensis TaxID=512762 RepID=A0A2S6IGZ5_9ACTN|nr:hypothetical protein [Kineococcus xinjiangensis]PPK93488.1 hypothetical protein CLV92_110116 [Kineococcus xinjiangensis]
MTSANTEVTVCVGETPAHPVGHQAQVEIVSAGATLASARVEVPGEVVLVVPEDAPEPRLLVDGEELSSSPRGGGWGTALGSGCPDAT